MCVVSAVFDHFNPLIPWPAPVNPAPKPWEGVHEVNPLALPIIELGELRRLIDEFKECLEAAKKLDKLMKQPDCEDPEKAKLLDRVAELEKLLKAEKKKTIKKKVAKKSKKVKK